MCRLSVLILLALVVLPGCSKSNPAGPTAASDGAAMAVKVVSPTKQMIAQVVEQPATVAPYLSAPLIAKLPGYVATIELDPKSKSPIDLGSEVKAGQRLATISIPELAAKFTERQAMLDQAEAELAAMQRELKVHEALILEAEAKVVEARAGVDRARADVNRWTTQLAYEDELLRIKTLDPESRNVTLKHLEAVRALQAEAEAKVATATAAVQQQRARLQRAEADVVTAHARVRIADAQVKLVRADLDYTEIRAPFDGIITARNIHPGHYVQPGVVLFAVAQVDKLRITVDIPEIAAERAHPGAAAVVRIPALSNREFHDGVAITRTSGVIQPDTRTLRTEIEIDNAQHTIRPGMYAYVSIRGEAQNALVVPGGCVLAADETHYVYLVEDGKAVKYRVRIVRTDGGNVQVLDRRRATITSGQWIPFTGTERVILGNLGMLTDGLAVEIKAD